MSTVPNIKPTIVGMRDKGSISAFLITVPDSWAENSCMAVILASSTPPNMWPKTSLWDLTRQTHIDRHSSPLKAWVTILSNGAHIEIYQADKQWQVSPLLRNKNTTI